MKIMLFTVITLCTFNLWAHCPHPFTLQGHDYCASVDWLPAEQKINGVFQETTEMSPVLNKKGSLPPQWKYSKASLWIWKREDAAHQSVFLDRWRVFPFMQMVGGHHHGASYQFAWDAGSQRYILSQMALAQMEGCWSLRGTTESTDEKANSESLQDIVEYSNLSDTEKFDVQSLCSLCGSADDQNGNNQSGHH